MSGREVVLLPVFGEATVWKLVLLAGAISVLGTFFTAGLMLALVLAAAGLTGLHLSLVKTPMADESRGQRGEFPTDSTAGIMKSLALNETRGTAMGAAPLPPLRLVSQLSARPALAPRADGPRPGIARRLPPSAPTIAGSTAWRVNSAAAMPGAETRFFSAQMEVADELQLMAHVFGGLERLRFALRFLHYRQGELESKGGSRAGCGGDGHARQSRVASRCALNHGCWAASPPFICPPALDLVSRLSPRATLIWKTNAHGTAQSRELLDGMFDLWLADFKFGNDTCAERLAGWAITFRWVQENLRWAAAHTDLIVRHLLMPGHLECCWHPSRNGWRKICRALKSICAPASGRPGTRGGIRNSGA